MSIAAANFCKRAHVGQVRKYTGEPYWFHPARVAALVAGFAELNQTTQSLVDAAFLHDVLEDTSCPAQNILNSFGHLVLELVVELTNQKAIQTYVNGQSRVSREVQKKLDRERLSTVSDSAKLIKLCDRYDNLRDLPVDLQNEGFILKYVAETRLLLPMINVHSEIADLIGSKCDDLSEAVNYLPSDDT